MTTQSWVPGLNNIKIKDPLWKKYVDMVARVIVPYQWDILNDRIPEASASHCLNNFRIAAGEKQGLRQGVVFLDTDVYKWLETVAYCIENGTGTEHEAIADEVIDLVGRAQQPDGYLNTYYSLTEPNARWSNLVEGHELYSAGYLIEAAVAYYTATGKNTLLHIARRFADLICTEFGPNEGQRKGYPGHQEIEIALIRLYHCTGEARYLACARYFIDERGKEPNYFLKEIERRGGECIFPEFREYDIRYAQAHMPPKLQRTAEGHAVRALYMFCAMADLAKEYRDQELLHACRALFDSVTQKRMYITGGVGSSGIFERFTTDYHLPNDSCYCETCASIALAMFGRRMAAAEHDASYYGAVERALYNTILAGVGAEGDRYFYVNPLEVWPPACMEYTSMQHVKPERQRWFDVACCPTNAARTLASLGRYIYGQDGDTVYINLFISSVFNAQAASARAVLDMDSRLTQDGTVIFHINVTSAPLTLAVRVPEYANAPTFTHNGNPVTPEIRAGYAIFHLDREGHYDIAADLHIRPMWMSADPRVRDDAGKTALTYGPFVYCLEETDNGGDLACVFVRPDTPVTQENGSELPGDLPALSYPGLRLARDGYKDQSLYRPAEYPLHEVRVKAVPYFYWGNRTPGEMLVWQKLALYGPGRT